MQDVFIGREAELAALSAAFGRAEQGSSQLVMLVGEPGVGKTRLAERWAAECSDRAHFAWARCYENQGTPPYWLWVQPLRTYLRGLDTERLAMVVDNAAPALLNLFPELGRRLSDIEPAAQSDDPVTARFRLYDAVAGLIARACRDEALVLILDDLHWADAPSLLLLEYVAREVRTGQLLILGTYRDVELRRTHQLTRTLGALTREQRFERIPLRCLTAADTAALANAVAGRSISHDLAATVFDRTDGNPLFVTEVARLLSATSDDTEAVRRRVPEGVREVIGTRLDGMSAGCVEALRWAALLGDECTVELLVDLQDDFQEKDVLSNLAEAVVAGVLVETRGESGSYRFTHALIRETVVEELLISEQVRMHAAIATELSKRADVAGVTNAAALAHHSLLAESVLGKEPARKYCSIAGDEAFAARAYESALEWYQRGVDLSPSEPLDDLGAHLVFGLARTMPVTPGQRDAETALAGLNRAFEHYMARQNFAAAVEVAAVEWWGWGERSAGLTAMVERALELVEPETEAAARLRLSHAIALYYESRRLTDALHDIDLVDGFATDRGDTLLHARCLLLRGEFAMWELDHRHARSCLAHALDSARQLDDIGMEARIYARGLAFVYGEGAEQTAEDWVEHATAIAERVRGRHGQVILGWAALRSTNLGDWDGSAEWRRRLAHVFEDPDYYQARLDWLAGEALDSVWPAVDNYIRTGGLTGGLHPNLGTLFVGMFSAELCYETGDHTRLSLPRRVARSVLRRPVVWPRMELHARLTMGWVSIVENDPEAARRQYDRVVAMRRPPVATLWSVDRILGMLAAAFADAEAARVHFEEAARFLREAGFRPELGWTCLHHGVLLRDQLDDPVRAAELLAEAQQIAGDLDMQPLTQHVARELGANTEAAVRPAGLTDRELDVLRLVAHGLANKEVAGELGIATQTVAVHLRNIFEKTAVRSRAEATLFATRHGLVQ